MRHKITTGARTSSILTRLDKILFLKSIVKNKKVEILEIDKDH